MENDLISRQAAIDTIFSEPLYESGMKKRDADVVVPEIYEKIRSLPSAQQWIPCSERLPKDGRYLCDYGDCIDFGRVTNGEWYVDGVIAWMPLPEPYREGEQDE